MVLTFQTPKSIVEIRQRKCLLVQLFGKTSCLVSAKLGQVGVAETGQEVGIRFFQKHVQVVHAEGVVAVFQGVKPGTENRSICMNCKARATH